MNDDYRRQPVALLQISACNDGPKARWSEGCWPGRNAMKSWVMRKFTHMKLTKGVSEWENKFATQKKIKLACTVHKKR